MSRRPKPKALGPTPERMARGDIEVVETMRAGTPGHRVKLPHALERYHARGELGDGRENTRRYDAGCRLRDCYETAGLEPSVIAAYSDMVAGSGYAPIDHKVGAYQAWKRALTAIGPIASNEVIDVCCFGQALRDRARVEILRRGLAVLADHYGM